MNVLKGAYRIQYAGRIVLTLAAVAFVFCILGFIISDVTSALPDLGLAIFHLLHVACIYLAVIGFVFMILGKIAEGLALPRNNTSGN